MKLGWKTITGALIVGFSGILKYLGQDQLGDLLIGLGTGFGLFGLRSAIANKK